MIVIVEQLLNTLLQAIVEAEGVHMKENQNMVISLIMKHRDQLITDFHQLNRKS